MPMLIRTREQANRLRMQMGRALALDEGKEYAPDNTPKYGPHKGVAPGREAKPLRGRPPKGAAAMGGVD